MADAHMWVPIIGSGREDDAFRPDAAAILRWWDGKIPSELDHANPERGKPLAYRYGRAAMRITIDEKDVAKVTNRIPDEDVPEGLRLIVDCIVATRRVRQTTSTGRVEFESAPVRQILAEKFAGMNAVGAEKRAIASMVLDDLKLRGLRAVDAEAVKPKAIPL